MIFVEKYKGKEFEDIIGYGDRIKSLCENGDIPHLLFHGRPGMGKSLSAEIIIHKLGLNYIKLNASDERGIDTLRGKLKDFAMASSSNGKRKVIWFDEFDSCSTDFYDAFRGFLETYQKTVSFIATCNHIHRVPEAIVNRFNVIEFKSPPIEDIIVGLQKIIKLENVNIGDDVLVELIKSCKNSVRGSINKLEMLSKLNRKIEMSDIVNDMELVETVHKLLKERNFPQARQELLNATIPAEDFMNDYHSYIMDLSITKKELSPDTTKKIIERFFEAISVLKFSANQDIVVEWLLLKIMELV
ncbi:MAG: AAA family ATPase [Spirochaetia bacterium]|nr:AAA family ATPase [Spirochaetia bacterium]